MKNYFSENLKCLRKNLGYTQEELAVKMNVSFQTISKWERGECCPDILTLPLIARIFNVSVDELLSVNKLEDEKKIEEYISQYQTQKRLGNDEKCLSLMKKAIKEFPSEYSLQIRYMEAIMRIKNTDKESANSIFNDVYFIYENIMKYCLDDEIRIWAKRLICTLYRRLDKFDEMIEIINHLPRMCDCKEQVRTLLLPKGQNHDTACKYAVEEHAIYLIATICHNKYYLDTHSLNEKIYAAEVAKDLLNLIYPHEDFGRLFYFMVYNYGHLGEWYFLMGDENKSLENFKKCASLALKYAKMPNETIHTSPLVEGIVYSKVKNENKIMTKTLKNRIFNDLMFNYKLTDEFRNNSRFKSIVNIVKD